jgi:hypothetical protein
LESRSNHGFTLDMVRSPRRGRHQGPATVFTSGVAQQRREPSAVHLSSICRPGTLSTRSRWSCPAWQMHASAVDARLSGPNVRGLSLDRVVDTRPSRS